MRRTAIRKNSSFPSGVESPRGCEIVGCNMTSLSLHIFWRSSLHLKERKAEHQANMPTLAHSPTPLLPPVPPSKSKPTLSLVNMDEASTSAAANVPSTSSSPSSYTNVTIGPDDNFDWEAYV